MDTETSVMVEAAYEKGLAERPSGVTLYTTLGGKPCFPNDPGLERSGWSLVKACWAKGMVVNPLDGHDKHKVLDRHGEELAHDPDPLRAMLSALNGGG